MQARKAATLSQQMSALHSPPAGFSEAALDKITTWAGKK